MELLQYALRCSNPHVLPEGTVLTALFWAVLKRRGKILDSSWDSVGSGWCMMRKNIKSNVLKFLQVTMMRSLKLDSAIASEYPILVLNENPQIMQIPMKMGNRAQSTLSHHLCPCKEENRGGWENISNLQDAGFTPVCYIKASLWCSNPEWNALKLTPPDQYSNWYSATCNDKNQ